MRKQQGSKIKMMFLTFIGLGVIAATVKIGRMIQEKKEKSNKRKEDYYG